MVNTMTTTTQDEYNDRIIDQLADIVKHEWGYAIMDVEASSTKWAMNWLNVSTKLNAMLKTYSVLTMQPDNWLYEPDVQNAILFMLDIVFWHIDNPPVETIK